jgi:hypothetical protein
MALCNSPCGSPPCGERLSLGDAVLEFRMRSLPWGKRLPLREEEEEEDDPRVGGQWRIATLSRRGKRSPAAGTTKYLCAPANGLTNDLHRTRVFLCPSPDPGLIRINTLILSRTYSSVLRHNSIQVCSCYFRHARLDSLLRWFISDPKFP